MQVLLVVTRLTRMLALKWVRLVRSYAVQRRQHQRRIQSSGVQLTAKLGYPITDDLDIYTVWVVWYGVQTPRLTYLVAHL